jgi:diaminopimelate epimerase
VTEHSLRDAALAGLEGVQVFKGHGTGNDFVIYPDYEGVQDLTPVQVRALCDRHRGIGGDGILRVVRTAKVEEVAEQATQATWFMDYRNGDGSLAEMCGNGARVFARYLYLAGLESADHFSMATRRGVTQVVRHDNGDIELNMGQASAGQVEVMPTVSVDERQWVGMPVWTSNPHCVVFVDEDGVHAENSSHLLATLDLSRIPAIEPASVFPESANVEFVVQTGLNHIALRVHERGVGETMACGTGACAAMFAAAQRDGAPLEVAYDVESPGGMVTVRRDVHNDLHLRGPAVIVSSITITSAVIQA